MNYAIPPAHTLEEHREYLYEIVKLKLFYLHLSLTEIHPEESFSQAIRNRVDIYRKTDANPLLHTPNKLFFDAPAWMNMESAAEEIFKQYSADTDSDRAMFEQKAFEVFRPSLDARCRRDWLDDSVLANYQCGSLKHDPVLKGETLNFHIANAVRPNSIFDDPLYMPRCFRALLRVAKEKFHAKYIYTGTWLNSCEKWLALFPPVWREHIENENHNVGWHYGFWGQFINAKGTYAKKTGDYLREHKAFRYWPKGSYILVDEMNEHISKILDNHSQSAEN